MRDPLWKTLVVVVALGVVVAIALQLAQAHHWK